MGRGDRALSDLDKAIALCPEDPEAWLLRGSIYYNETQLERALGDLREAIRLKPEEPAGYQLLAEALLRKRDAADAINQVDLALSRDSCFVPAYVTLGEIHKAYSRIEKAVEAYSMALNIDPDHFDARLKRAQLYVEINEHGQALKDLQHAAKINPHSGEVYQLRARCHEALGETEKAQADTWKARVFAHRGGLH
jgi:tetratricopeptide (TPR) repeat protein